MAVIPVPGSERFEVIDKRPDELSVSPCLQLFEARGDTELDPITYEVISHKLVQVNAEIGATIRKVSGSVVVNEAYDFNTALGDERGDLFTIGDYLGVHATTLQQMIRWTIENRSDAMEEGDMFLLNDPWVGAAHQNDLSLLCPIFVGGKLYCWSGCTLHVVDVGGVNPGSFCVDAEDVFSEGMPMPPVRLVRGGELQRDVEEAFLRRSRTPALVALDLRAMIAANNVATARIRDLVAQYGAPTVHTTMKRILDTTEAHFRDRLSQLPDGTWKHLHLYEVSKPGDRRVHKVITTMTKEGDSLRFDASESDPQTGFFNVTRPVFQAGIITAVLPLLCPDLPWAPGALLRVIDFQFEPGTIPAARFPAAVSGGTTTGGWVGVNSATVLVSKMLSAAPEELKQNLCSVSHAAWLLQVLAGVGKDGNPMVTVSLDQAAGGIGARSWRDGDDTGGAILSPAGRIANVETQEWYYPILYLFRRELRDSGGPGRFRGGVGAESALIPHDTPWPLGGVCSAFSVAVPNGDGICGGLPARTGFYQLARNSRVRARFAERRVPTGTDEFGGEVEWLPPKLGSVVIGHDDVYHLGWSGGGGYGDPLERDPERIAWDVREGYVSLEEAERVYGVVFRDGDVDVAATHALRGRLRGERVGRDALPEPPAASLPEGARWVDENVVVTREGELACGRCQHVLATGGAGYKSGTVVLERPLEQTGRVWIPPEHYIDDRVCLRQFACPGCGTLLENEVSLVGSEPVDDKRISWHVPAGSGLRASAPD